MNDSKQAGERWTVAHARANRGHRTTESLGSPGVCETCGARSPAWDLVEPKVASRVEGWRGVFRRAWFRVFPPAPKYRERQGWYW